MDDNRVSHSNRQHPFDGPSNNRADSFPLSESVRYQEILLHKQLREEIEKNPTSRYVDSELYFRNNLRSPALGDVGKSSRSEVQSATLNIGANSMANNSTNSKQVINNSKTAIFDNTPFKKEGDYQMEIATNSNESPQHYKQQQVNKNCQVCLIKEVRQDLMNVNKIIKDHNEQIKAKLKAKRLRSSFEDKI